MKRREFVAWLGCAAAWAAMARGQPAKNPVRLAFLPLGSPDNKYEQSLVEAFRYGLRQFGWIEGRDVLLDVVWISGDPNEALSRVLNRGADLLITCGSSASVAAKRQTSTIPIGFLSVGDPIAMGLAESLSRPGHNATGFSDSLADLSGKLVDLASSFPQSSIDYFWYTAWPDRQNRYQATEQADQVVGMTFRSKGIAEIDQLDDALSAISQSGSRMVIVQPQPVHLRTTRTHHCVSDEEGAGHIFAFPVAAREGSLIGYGPDYIHIYGRAPIYIDRILKGATPSDLPVQQPIRVEFLINVSAAKTLGIEVPLSCLFAPTS